jgi:hypothetical protein
VLHVSRFVPDPDRFAEFIACLWQGSLPDDLELQRWIYIDGEPRQMVLIWEGGEDAAHFVDERFGAFGLLTTEGATEATGGLAACFDRDLEGFGRWMRGRGSSEPTIDSELDLRAGGLHAASLEEAAASGRAWRAGRAG